MFCSSRYDFMMSEKKSIYVLLANSIYSQPALWSLMRKVSIISNPATLTASAMPA